MNNRNIMLDQRVGQEAFSVEQVYFTKTSKKVNPKNTTPFKYWQGDIPILITAPHAVRHERKKITKVSDEFTGSLAYLIHKHTKSHALAVTKLYGGDPNFDYPCLFKEKVKEICIKNNIKIVLDLHGASREKPFDIDLGTMRGESLMGTTKPLSALREAFGNYGITNVTIDYFPGITQQTIIKFAVRELGVPALQIKINRKYRVPHQNPEAYCRILSAFVKAIGKL